MAQKTKMKAVQKEDSWSGAASFTSGAGMQVLGFAVNFYFPFLLESCGENHQILFLFIRHFRVNCKVHSSTKCFRPLRPCSDFQI